MKIQQREILFAFIVGIAASLAVVGMPKLVAAPKVLFGRSLTAIEPSLFPYVTLSIVVLLAIALILVSWRSAVKTAKIPTQSDEVELDSNSGWIETAIFFVLLTSYGLLLKPIGFLISSFLVISAISILLGNRNWLQILLLAILAPICLYLIATRAMLVSLPELNQIELWYANAINWVMDRVAQ